jgi:hypothetical protein
MANRTLEITNKRIRKFYNDNPNINFEAVNLIFIELFEKLSFDPMSNAFQSQILSTIRESTQDISELKQTISSLKESIQVKMVDINQTYIEDLRTIIQTNSHETIAPLIEKNNNMLIDKTKLLLNESIPKQCSQINDLLTSFTKVITDETHCLMKANDAQSIKDFINNFEMKSAVLLQNVQQPLYSFISASEERINNNIKDGNSQHKVLDELSCFLNKFQNVQALQQLCDKQLSSILTKLYNSAEIINRSGLLLLKRIRKTNVIFENKNTEQNVGIDDINAFLQVIDEEHCNGIFISQNSGISTKKNYQIEIHNNNIVVFIHNMEYNPAKIEIAMDIIDSLSNKLRQFKSTTDNDCSIPKDVLDTINNEYQMFLTQKAAVADVFKESQKKVIAQIDEIRFPSLDKFLSTKYSAPIQKPGLKCDMCKSFSANNLKALAAHKRGCARKQTNSIIPNAGVTVSTK